MSSEIETVLRESLESLANSVAPPPGSYEEIQCRCRRRSPRRRIADALARAAYRKTALALVVLVLLSLAVVMSR